MQRALLGATMVLLANTPAVWANLVLGACCFDSGECQDLMVTQCDDAGAEFIGVGTSCATTNCSAPVAAPLLSAAGAVAAASGLLGIGALRLLRRRRS